MSAEIHYQRLNADNFTGYSLDDFVRHQTVTECWRKIDNDWKLVPNVYEENWSQVQCREIAEDMVHNTNLDQTGFGAFDGERIIGFATVSHRIFGTASRYVQLVCFQISEEYRRQGIGRKLYNHVLAFAKQSGCYNVTLNVWACNPAAMRFYESCGLLPQKVGMEKVLDRG